jgi:hypothetical protein
MTATPENRILWDRGSVQSCSLEAGTDAGVAEGALVTVSKCPECGGGAFGSVTELPATLAVPFGSVEFPFPATRVLGSHEKGCPDCGTVVTELVFTVAEDKVWELTSPKAKT